MLQSMHDSARSGALKLLMMAFLVFAVLGLVMMDVGGYFRGGVGNTNVAKVGGDALPITDFDRTVSTVLARQGLDKQTAYQLGFINQILQMEINRITIAKAAHDLGLRVSDKEIAEQLSKILQPYVSEDLSQKEALTGLLRQQGMTESQFVNLLRGELTKSLLGTALQVGAGVMPQDELKDLYQYIHETRDAVYVYFPNEKVEFNETASEEILTSLYEAGKEMKYAIPETRTFSMLVLSPDHFKDEIDISEDILHQTYEENIEMYGLPERRVIQQAILSDKGPADELVKKVVTDGKTFETTAQEAYLGEITTDRNGLIEELVEPVFAAEDGTVVGPVQTALGWQVVFVKKHLPEETRPFEEVRDDLYDHMLADQLANQMYALANTVDDRVAAGGTLEEIAAELEVEIKQYGPLQADGSTPDHREAMTDFEEDSGYVLDTVYSLLEEEIAPVMELSDGRFAVIRVDSVVPKSYKGFEEVRNELNEIWIEDQKVATNKILVRSTMRQLQAKETTLKDIGKLDKVSKLSRDSELAAPLSKIMLSAIFEAGQGDYFMAEAEGGFVLGRVETVNMPDVADIPEDDLTALKEKNVSDLQNEFFGVYLQQARDLYGVKINQSLFDRVYAPGSEENF